MHVLLSLIHPNLAMTSIQTFIARTMILQWHGTKMYGKGRVFYSSLGYAEEAWDDPDIRKMYFEAVKWVLGMAEGSTTPHPQVTP